MPAPQQPAVQQAEQPQSLYRRHRPRTFDQIVGQDAVVRTLRNAVQREKVHHAYLFVGSRGTGKTSMAKILAACLNCENGPTVEPCGVCQSCLSIASASSLDVIELDAASSNSVDDIRELRESVAYAPVSGGRKVYILDEAHMLSTAAWNAFLKTLEEPPPNTMFVLATTEAQKVPPTVIDRCHRFDFQRAGVEQIATVLDRVVAQESIEIPPAAVAAIARAAGGSFRDALGTLEQLVTYSGSEIVLEDVLAVLGVTDAALLEATVDAVAAGDAPAALRAIEEASAKGRDAAAFASDLERRARELLIVATLDAVPPELSLTDEADDSLRAQAARVDAAVLVRLLELLGAAMEAVRAGADARTRLELALVKAARPELDASTGALLARLQRLERERGDSDGDTPQPGASARAAPASAPGREQAPAGAVDAAPTAGNGPGDSPSSVQRHHAATGSEDPPPAAASAERAPTARVCGDGLDSLRSAWPAVVEMVRSQNALLGALIEEAQPVAVAGAEVTVAFSASAPFLKKKAEDPANRQAVSEALGTVMGGRWSLSYALGEESQSPRSAGTQPASEEDWIKRLMDAFEAEELAPEWQPDGDKPRAAAERRAAGAGSEGP